MRHLDKCKCNDEPPKRSGNPEVRAMLSALNFNLAPAGEIVDRHDCHYVQAINKLINKASELAYQEELVERGVVDYRGLRYFHKYINKLAEEKGLRRSSVRNGVS